MHTREDFSVINRKQKRIQVEEKVKGTFPYVEDMPSFPGMLYCEVLRSPRAHARVVKIDIEKAKKLEGVVDVVTHWDIGEQFIQREISADPNKPRPWDSYLLEKEVRYVGDRVAAVVAESPAIAAKALTLIDVEYEDLPAVFDIDEAIKPGAPKVHEYNYTAEKTIEIKNNVVAPITMNTGDVEQGFEEADFIVENKFRTGRQFNSPIGRPCCIARDRKSTRLNSSHYS